MGFTNNNKVKRRVKIYRFWERLKEQIYQLQFMDYIWILTKKKKKKKPVDHLRLEFEHCIFDDIKE